MNEDNEEFQEEFDKLMGADSFEDVQEEPDAPEPVTKDDIANAVAAGIANAMAQMQTVQKPRSDDDEERYLTSADIAKIKADAKAETFNELGPLLLPMVMKDKIADRAEASGMTPAQVSNALRQLPAGSHGEVLANDAFWAMFKPSGGKGSGQSPDGAQARSAIENTTPTEANAVRAMAQRLSKGDPKKAAEIYQRVQKGMAKVGK